MFATTAHPLYLASSVVVVQANALPRRDKAKSAETSIPSKQRCAYENACIPSHLQSQVRRKTRAHGGIRRWGTKRRSGSGETACNTLKTLMDTPKPLSTKRDSRATELPHQRNGSYLGSRKEFFRPLDVGHQSTFGGVRFV